jgi:multiple sugar transport system substrate-binding protein
VQYLLSNGIQLGYAETEGYLPVTRKALESNEYTDYLARAGEDNKDHYRVKIEASRLLMENTKNTFVTPVFNGSASLRAAAGQLIENTVKGARRKQEMNEAFIEKLYSEVSSLYRLDQISGNRQAREIPTGSWVLLGTIAVIWAVIGLYKLREAKKNKTKQ